MFNPGLTLIVRLQGGLANQLSQFAYGLQLSKDLGRTLHLDTSLLEMKRVGVTHWLYGLDSFNSSTNILSLVESRSHGILSNPKVIKIFSRFRLPYKKYKYFFEGSYNFDDLLKVKDTFGIVLEGYWQTPVISTKILDEFKLKVSNYIGYSSEEYQLILASVRVPNSVAVHIRRGDYISNTKAAKLHAICDVDYYDRAIKLIESRLKSPSFYIFTDDPDWAFSNINIRGECTFVSGKNGFANFQELFLMSECSNFIIANSSFSWWAALLSSNANKIVIAPKVWHKGKKIPDGFIPKSWILL